MQRNLLGGIALVLILVGGVGTFTDFFGGDAQWWAGVALRTGILLGALWLVVPRAREVPRPVWIGVVVLAVFVAARPRLVLFGIGAAFIAMVAAAIVQRRAGNA